MIALLDRSAAGLARGDAASGTGGWGAPSGSLGALWGDAIGDAFGTGGVDLSGTGEGGGGHGEGIAIGGVGTIGSGFGTCGGCDGDGHGRLGGRHVTRSPSIRCGSPPPDPSTMGPFAKITGGSGCAAQVNGRLPPEVVQRIVRQSHGRFRFCYERGLARDPSLEGRVTVRFVIARDGSVSTAQDGGSELRDADVVSCVVRGFSSLSFPQPEGGIVTVVYPLVLSPT
jgi:hypothetical protein